MREIERAWSPPTLAEPPIPPQRASATGTPAGARPPGIAGLLQRGPRRRGASWSPTTTLGYFADRYGIEVVGAVFPSQTTQAQPSAGELSELAETIEAEGVEAVFPECSLSPKVAEAIAAQTGATAGLPLWRLARAGGLRSRDLHRDGGGEHRLDGRRLHLRKGMVVCGLTRWSRRPASPSAMGARPISGVSFFPARRRADGAAGAKRRRQDDPDAGAARRARPDGRRRCGSAPAARRSRRPSAPASTTPSPPSTWPRWARSPACPGGGARAAPTARWPPTHSSRSASAGSRARPSASSPAASASAC